MVPLPSSQELPTSSKSLDSVLSGPYQPQLPRPSKERPLSLKRRGGERERKRERGREPSVTMSALRRSAAVFRRLAYVRPFAATPTAATPVLNTEEKVPPSVDRGLGTVRDVLKTKGEKFYYTRGDALVYDAVKKMVHHNIGSLIIVEGAEKRPVGIITEKDYLNKVIVKGRSSRSTLVREIMSTKQFTSVSPSATLHECMELMTERRIRHIPVVEPHSSNVLGMLSIGDIVSELVAAHKRNADHMRSFISGGY